MNTFKSIWAVFAGILVNVILSTATDYVLELAGIFPPASGGLFITWMLALALGYRMIYAVLGGYATAWLAPQNPMKHVWILAYIGIALGCLGVVVGWNLSQHWYPIALAVTAIPCTLLGGKWN